MTTPGDPPNELDRLLSELVEGELAPADQERLTALLRDNPDLRQKYVDYLLLDSLLYWEQPEPVQPVIIRPTRRRWYAVAALAGALAAGILVAVALWPGKSPDQMVEVAGEPTDDTIAVLLHTSGAVWEDTDMPTRPGAPLPPGQLRLKSGVVRLEFYCGATVILEGPAELQLISRTKAFCASGKLRATVPPHAEGFAIGTPSLDLVDRGTEFGLQVGPTGEKTEVHVFQGKVDLYGAGDADQGPPQKELTTGQGVRMKAAGAADTIPPDPAAFMTARKLEGRLAAEVARRQQEWTTACAAWRRDPSLRVFYTFQDNLPWSRTLTDQAADRWLAYDGTIVGGSWVTGRWPGKQGLEFKRVSDRVLLNVPGAFQSVTLATWVRVDSLPNINNSLLMTDGWEAGELHWQIGRDGTLVLGVQSDPKGQGAHYHALGAITPERFGNWIHLAVTYDHEAGLVTHFVDGEAVSESLIQSDVSLRVSEAELGNWNVATHRNKSPIRFLNGCLDEFMLFTRALSTDEIEQLYTRGRPPS